MQAAIIPADNAKLIRFEDIDPAPALHGLVGGDFQLVGLRPYSMNMYLNENGKLEQLPSNLRATVLCNWVEAIRIDDFICGDAVLLGPINDDEGEDIGLADVGGVPAELARAICRKFPVWTTLSQYCAKTAGYRLWQTPFVHTLDIHSRVHLPVVRHHGGDAHFPLFRSKGRKGQGER